MPKKNAFFFFITKRKEEMIESGVKITGGLAQVSQMVDAEWQALSEQEKSVFKDKADNFNNVVKVTENSTLAPEAQQPGPSSGIKNCRGENIEVIHLQAKQEAMMEEEMRRIFVRMTTNQHSAQLPIVIIKFSTYENGPNQTLIPAEVALCAFSLERGIFDNYASLIDPGLTGPISSKSIQNQAKKMALPEPNYEAQLRNYGEIFNDIGFFITKNSRNFHGEPYVFSLKKDALANCAGFEWLFNKVGRGLCYKMLSLDLLIKHISCLHYEEKMLSDTTASFKDFTVSRPSTSSLAEEEVEMYDLDENSDPGMADRRDKKKKIRMAAMEKTVGDHVAKPAVYPFVEKGIFFNAEHVDYFFKSSNYAYIDELACLYHMDRRDGVSYCPMNSVNRYAYCLMDVLLQNFNVKPRVAKHYPSLDNLELERSERIKMLQKWAKVDYARLALAEKAKDQELIEADEAWARPPIAPQLPKQQFRYGRNTTLDEEMDSLMD